MFSSVSVVRKGKAKQWSWGSESVTLEKKGERKTVKERQRKLKESVFQLRVGREEMIS